MFNNCGTKIKNVAFWLCVILGAFSILGGFIGLISSDGETLILIISLVCMLLGPILLWFSFLLLYAFGELVENSTVQRKLLEAYLTPAKKDFAEAVPVVENAPVVESTPVAEAAPVPAFCTNCGAPKQDGCAFCTNCGNKF